MRELDVETLETEDEPATMRRNWLSDIDEETLGRAGARSSPYEIRRRIPAPSATPGKSQDTYEQARKR